MPVNYSLGTRRGILNPSKPRGHVSDVVFKSLTANYVFIHRDSIRVRTSIYSLPAESYDFVSAMVAASASRRVKFVHNFLYLLHLNWFFRSDPTSVTHQTAIQRPNLRPPPRYIE